MEPEKERVYQVMQVRLRGAGKISYFRTGSIRPNVGDSVIVEAERGIDYGEVLSEPEVILEHVSEQPPNKILRVATKEDLWRIQENEKRIKGPFKICQKKIQFYNLKMKLIEAEYSFDRSKIVFYFTAEGRVDFRELVKDLARIFKVRIELKQIGVRDEAKLLGGFGPCGRPLCCAKFLKDFEPVTIRMAKEQGLSLNPTKISGLCGRLMCCLEYEYPTYKALWKELPKQGQVLNTKDGRGKVVSVNALKRQVLVEVGTEGKVIEVNL